MQGFRGPEAPDPMVASDKFTIRDDQGAKPNTGAGTKAPQATSAYDEYPYEMENAEDGSSTYPHNSPNEAHHEPQVQNPGAGQHANKSWPQKMPNSPRPPETSDTDVPITPVCHGPAQSGRPTSQRCSKSAPPSTARSVR